MYQNDSFFDLTVIGRIGLICLSVLMFLVTIWAVYAFFRARPVWLQVIWGFVLFYIFVWVSPQIYYQYYMLLIPDLSWQWVIFPLPSPMKAMEFLTFQGPQSLSAHSKAFLGWLLILLPLLKARRAA